MAGVPGVPRPRAGLSELTRLQIADVLGDAFGPRGADKEALVRAARRAGSPTSVLDELERLPDRTYRSMESVWRHLWEVTVA